MTTSNRALSSSFDNYVETTPSCQLRFPNEENSVQSHDQETVLVGNESKKDPVDSLTSENNDNDYDRRESGIILDDLNEGQYEENRTETYPDSLEDNCDTTQTLSDRVDFEMTCGEQSELSHANSKDNNDYHVGSQSVGVGTSGIDSDTDAVNSIEEKVKMLVSSNELIYIYDFRTHY